MAGDGEPCFRVLRLHLDARALLRWGSGRCDNAHGRCSRRRRRTQPGGSEGRREGDVVPVKLHAAVTEIGTLLLEAVPIAPQKADERWKIELGVRAEG